MDPRLLLLITSGPLSKHEDLRQACRETWLLDSGPLGIPYFFVLSSHDVPSPQVSERETDLVTLPGSPLYNYLPQRTTRMLSWALGLHYQWTHVFKCDDDTYVCLPRLTTYPYAQAHYIGVEWKPLCNYGSGGAGYFLSRHAAREVTQRLTEDRGAEDVLVGQHLRAAAISFQNEPRLVPFGNDQRRPLPSNNLLTSHYASPQAMHETHALLQACRHPSD